MQAGKKVYQQIDEAIRVYDRLLLILSEDSMQSEWVKTEISSARKKSSVEAQGFYSLSVLSRSPNCANGKTSIQTRGRIRPEKSENTSCPISQIGRTATVTK
ncbi:TIR domain-containing protein [Tunturiibacter lichenicola]|uniref:TIR domain-containing protein n=1 Tax=Tunturiibacter lichenicola TaxID=2051959 RepID=UPI0036F2EDD4